MPWPVATGAMNQTRAARPLPWDQAARQVVAPMPELPAAAWKSGRLSHPTPGAGAVPDRQGCPQFPTLRVPRLLGAPAVAHRMWLLAKAQAALRQQARPKAILAKATAHPPLQRKPPPMAACLPVRWENPVHRVETPTAPLRAIPAASEQARRQRIQHGLLPDTFQQAWMSCLRDVAGKVFLTPKAITSYVAHQLHCVKSR